MTELERCDKEIRQIEVLLRSGHQDLDGLLLALVDWRTERRLLMAAEEEGNGYSRTDSKTNGGRDHGGAAWPSAD